MATFADYLSAGKGAVEYRLVIEGCPYEFVTEQRMEGALGDGRYRVRGLLTDGLSISEKAYIAGAELDVSLGSIRIAETDGPYRDSATATFSGFTSASPIAWLKQGTTVEAADATMSVQDASGITVNQYLHIGTEVVQVTAITLSSGAAGSAPPDTISVTRGLWRSTAQGFKTTNPSYIGSEPMVVALTTQPATYAGRRVWLYGHGSSEASTGSTGTLIYRGMIGENPELVDSRTWSLSIRPRTALLDCDIGFGTQGDGAKLRGIYYSGQAPLYITFNRNVGANDTDAIQDWATLFFYGFFETQHEFAQALTNEITNHAGLYGRWLLGPTASYPASWGTWDAEVTSGIGRGAGASTLPDTWDLYFTTPSSSPLFVKVFGGSPIDGFFNGIFNGVTLPSGALSPVPVTTRTVSASLRYTCSWIWTGWSRDAGYPQLVPMTQMRTVPRACYSAWSNTSTAADRAAAPFGRFYLDQVLPFIDWGTATLTPPIDPPGATPAPTPWEFTASASSTAGWIGPDPATGLARATHIPPFAAAGTFQPTIQLTAAYGNRAGDNVYGFVQSVITGSTTSAGGGAGGPFILNDDIADWSATVYKAASADPDGSHGRSFLMQRIYSFSKKQKLIDVLREELKLYGLYLYLDANCQIGVRQYPDATATAAATIDKTVHLVDDDFGTMKLAPNGIVNGVTIKSSYSRKDDRWDTIDQFRNLQAQVTARAKGTPITIAPLTNVSPSLRLAREVSISDAAALAGQIIGYFGSQYYIVTIPVAITLHSVRIGDVVTMTVPQLPFGGGRGSTTTGAGFAQTNGTVVGREWHYGDKPGGALDVLVTGLNLAGYTPSASVTSASGSGTSWTLTTAAAAFGPGGSTHDSDYFSVGFKVVLCQHDAEQPVRITGTVGNVTTDSIPITLDSPWTGMGSSSWILRFDGSAVVTAAQQKYCFMASPTGRIQYSDHSAPARQFA